MDAQYKTLLRMMLLLCATAVLTACQDTIPNRETIVSNNLRPLECPEGQEVKEIVENNRRKQVCQEIPKPPVRPSNAVRYRPDFCACKDGKPVSFGNCTNFCSGKGTNGAQLLFASFDVTAEISLSGLNHTRGWCQIRLPNDEAIPNCRIEAKDEDGGVQSLPVNSWPTNNSLVADVGALADDKTYILTLVETVSGARSNSVQIIKYSVDLPIQALGPLKQTPVSQYTCIVREFSQDSNNRDIFYDQAYRLHFYFIPRMPPDPLPAGTNNIFCHDIFNPRFGLIDSVEAPRLELRPGVFNLWDTMDPRFFDNNGNGNMDVNDVIVQRTRNFGGSIGANSNFFLPFRWFGAPQLNAQAGNSNSNNQTQPIGYFMAPWIDQQTFKSYCPTSTQYNSNIPVFQAMRDLIGVDTEGLYVGEKAPETIFVNGQATTGMRDYILIRESDLKDVWFYLKNGVPTAPTDDNVANVAVFFYYPLNRQAPFVKSSSQRIFRVRGASELSGANTNASVTSGGSTTFPPHDRKIGCVPKF